MRIVADPNIPLVEKAFAEFGEVRLVNGRDCCPAAVADADVLLVRSVTPVHAQLLDGSPVRFVGTATSGTDHLDIEYLQSSGIAVASALGSNANSVAEYIVSAILALAQQRERRIKTLTVGIVGCGHVGRAVSRKLQALGAHCILNDPPLKDQTGDVRYRELTELLRADVISLHVPLTIGGRHATRHLIGDPFLSHLNPDAVIINTARGGVVDEHALLRRLSIYRSMGTVIDCWAGEPNINQELLARADLATAHIAGHSYSAKLQATEMLYRALCEHLGVAPRDGVLFRSPPTAVLYAGDTVDDETAIRQAVFSCYDVRIDSAALKNLLQIPQQARGVAFDKLRDHYPKRGEFRSIQVQLPCVRSQLGTTLEGLGFKIAGGSV